MATNGDAEAGPSNGRQESEIEDLKKPIIEDDETSRYTIERFENVQVGGGDQDLKPLRELKSKFQLIIGRIENGINLARDTAMAVEQASQDDEMIDKIEAGLFQSLEEIAELTFRINAIDEVITRLKAEEDIPDLFALYNEAAQKRIEEYGAKTPRQKFKDDEAYMTFRQGIWEIHHEGEACPPMSRWLPRSDGDASDDEDFEVGGTLQTFKCPITLMPFTDAAKSTVCGHHYDYTAILGHIQAAQRGKRRCKCPVPGCSHDVAKDNIIRDPAMQQRAAAHAARQADRSAAEEDDDQFISIDL